MGGGGESAPNAINPNPVLTDTLGKRAMLSSDPKVAAILSDYAQGKLSQSDALNSAKSLFGAGAPSREEYFAKNRGAEVDKWVKEFSRGQRDIIDYERSKSDIEKSISQMDEKTLKAMGGRDALLNTIDKKKYDKAMSDIRFKAEKQADQQLQGAYENVVRDNPYGAGSLDQFQALLTTAPGAAQRYATDEIMNNPLTRGLYGKGGMQDQVQEEAQRLMGVNDQNSNQYQSLLDEIKGGEWQKLTPEDHSAYGLMSGDIARMYGTQEQGLAQSLADRGLAQAPSGSAGALFSGLQGNKMEQLAGAQRKVLQDRVDTAMKTFQLRGQTLNSKADLDYNRLSNARNTGLNLGTLLQTSVSNLFNRNMAGRSATEQELANASDRELKNKQAYQDQLNMQFQQQQATKGPGFGDILGAAGGIGLGAMTGGFGTAVGANLGKGLFGGSGGDSGASQSTNPYTQLSLNGPLFKK